MCEQKGSSQNQQEGELTWKERESILKSLYERILKLFIISYVEERFCAYNVCNDILVHIGIASNYKRIF